MQANNVIHLKWKGEMGDVNERRHEAEEKGKVKRGNYILIKIH